MDTDSRRKIWDNIFQLSQAVFRVTHLFPQEEILRRHLRSKITEILYQASQSVIASEAKPARTTIQSGGQSRYTFPVVNHLPLANALHNFRGLLFSAKNCNFVHEQNFVILIKECAKIIEFLELCEVELSRDEIVFKNQALKVFNVKTSQIQNSIQPNIGFFAPNPRQQKLLDYLQKCQDEKLQLKDIAEEFKDVQPRTIRQDLKELCDGGYLTRNGRGAGSYYIFSKNNTS